MSLPIEHLRVSMLRKPAKGFRGIAIFTFAILLPPLLHAQWEEVHTFPQPVLTVHFMDQVGRPDVGFVSTYWNNGSYYFWRTSDGCKTWQGIDLPPKDSRIGVGVRDLTFKDSLNGWMANYINFRTTDGGLSWIPLTPANGPDEYDFAISYNPISKLLFSTEIIDFDIARVSSDEGNTWSDFGGGDGYWFSGLNGILTAADIYPLSAALYTTDGGVTWAQSNFHDECYQPACLPETTTFFAASEHANRVSRSDDGGKTWRTIYQFSSPSHGTTDSSLGGCIRVDHCGNLYVSTFEGFLMSSDEGASWHSIGGPSQWMDVRFWVTSDYLYASNQENPSIYDDVYSSTLWRYPLHNPGLVFSDGSKRTSLSAGSDATVNFTPTGNEMIGADSVHFLIHFDSASLALKDFILSGGWTILDSGIRGDTLDLWAVFDSSGQMQNPNLQLIFKTFLASSSAKVYLDSAHFYGECQTCDCSLSANGPDSAEIDFTGCGDPTLLAAMQGQPPFSIESIVPNPAQTSFDINVSNPALAPIAYTLFDALGNEVFAAMGAGRAQHVPTEGLPSGTYFLRLSENGYVQSREISVEH